MVIRVTENVLIDKKPRKRHRERPAEAKWWYPGPTESVKMDPEAIRAYNSWRDQRHRCRSDKLECYKYYGGKGVQVKYGSREFVGWWLEQQADLKLKKPTISRIDHDGHYEFGNIKLEEHIDNCVKDTLARHGAPSKHQRTPVIITDLATGKDVAIVESQLAAAKFVGGRHSNVNSVICGRNGIKSVKGYTFRLA